MTSTQQQQTFILFTFLSTMSVGIGQGQTQEQSPSHFIQFLTWQSDDRRGKPMTFTCGQVRTERAAAKSIANLGSSALPEIERVLDSIEKSSQESKNAIGAAWMLYAYTKILGPAAQPRLQRMMTIPNLGFLRLNLDYSMALSFNLTSYVSGFRKPEKVFHCHRHEEPRDTLNQLILAWERNDRPLLEASLGPNARAALESTLRGKTWARLRSDLWSGKSGDQVAVGYRFDISGAWSEPDETLDPDREWGDAAALSEQSEFRLDTLFKDSSGVDCGRFHVKFIQTGGEQKETLPYLVDNSDFGDLLSTIASCAGRNRNRNIR